MLISCTTRLRHDRNGHWHPVGCPACSRSGYKGRTGVYELMLADDAIRELVHNRASDADVTARARLGGYRPMRDDGQRLLTQGVARWKRCCG